MENQARLANAKASGIPKAGSIKPAAAAPYIADNSADGGSKLKARTSLPSAYEASGQGLSLCAPKVATSFTVSSTAAKRLKATDLKVTIKGSAAVKPDIRERKDGSLEVWYTAPMSGEYRITAAIGAANVAGSPFRVLCQQPRASEALSQLDLQGSCGFAGERYTARLTCLDQFGGRFTGRTDVSAAVLDANTPLFDATVIATGDGTFEISFRPEISGSYGLAVHLDGSRPLQGSPFLISVRNDETIAANCKLYGAGLTQAVAGQQTSFTIQAVDGKHNARVLGGDSFQVEVVGPSAAPPAALVKDNLDGTYDMFWTTETAGTYLITAKLDGTSLGGCPVSCTVRPTDLDARKCIASGPGLSKAQAGQPAHFHITAADSFGNQRGSGGDTFALVVRQLEGQGRAEVAGKVEDAGQGMYRAQYAVNIAGTYEVAVTAAGQPIQGSPFLCHVAAGPVDPRSSRLQGPGLTAVQLGQPSQIYIELADQYGNKAQAAGLDAAGIKVTVDGPSPTPVTPGAVTNAMCAFTYHAQDPGTYTISARVGSEHMLGSPATVVASIAEAHALLCQVKGAPLTLSTVAGERVGFMIVAKDAKGVQKSLGGDKFTVQWQLTGDGAPPSTGTLEDLGTGEYRSSFSSTKASNYSVSVMHDGRHIGGSPFAADVSPSGICPEHSYALGQGIVAAQAGQQALLCIKASDRYGNPVPASKAHADPIQGFQVAVVAADGQPIASSWQAGSAGELTASYMPLLAGCASVSATWQGTHLKGSPWQVPVAPSPGSAKLSTVTGLPSQLVAGQPATLTVSAEDAFGNTTAGGDRVTVSVDNPLHGTDLMPVMDLGNGSYQCTVATTTAGLLTVTATINGEQIGQPVTVSVVAAELHSLFAHSSRPRAVAGQPLCLTFGAQDSFGNVLRNGGAQLHAQLRRPSNLALADVAAEVADSGDGRYQVTCTMEAAGDFQVTLWSEHTPDAPISVSSTCQPGATSAQHCIIPRLPESAIAGMEGQFKVWRTDAFGNRLTNSLNEAALLVAAHGPGVMQTIVHDCGDGSVDITYMAETSGSYELNVSTADGQPVRGCPFRIDIHTASVFLGRCRAHSTSSADVVAGQDLVLELNAYDRYDNVIPSLLGHDVAVIATGPATVALTADPKQALTYRGVLDAAGAYLVDAKLDGESLPGWPQALHVQPAKSHAPACQLRWPALSSQLTVGTAAQLCLHTLDAFENARISGGEVVSCTIRGPAAAAEQQASIQDNDNGSYSVCFTPDLPGRWHMCPSIDGVPVRQEGFDLQALYGPLRAADCAVDLCNSPATGACCGSTVELVVRTTDAAGPGRCLAGTKAMTACCVGPSGIHQSLAVVHSDGACRISWPITAIGNHAVHVLLDQQHVISSPLPVSCQPGPVCVAATTITGPGLASCVAGEQATFTIHACDAWGHDAIATDGTFSVEAHAGDKSQTGTVIASSDSTLQVTYIRTHAGPFQLHVACPGNGSSAARVFRGVCKPAALHLPCCNLASQQLTTTAGQPAYLRIAAHDRFGNPIKQVPSLTSWTAAVSGPSRNIEAWFTRARTGHIELACLTDTAGIYTISVSDASGASLPDISLKVSPGPTSPAHSLAKPTNQAAVGIAGKPLELQLHLADEYGNATMDLGGQPLAMKAVGPSAVELQQGEELCFSGVLTRAGSYAVSATLADMMLPGWPQQLHVVTAQACARKSRLAGQALQGVVCHGPASVSLHTCDAFGNDCVDGGAVVDAHLLGSGGMSCPAQVADNHNGTYMVSFTLPTPGLWTLHVTVDGTPISDAGTSMKASMGALAAKDCQLCWAPDQEGTAQRQCGATCHFEIQAEDAGHKLTGQEALIMQVTAPSGDVRAVPVVLAEHGSHLQAAVHWLQTGQHQVAAFLHGAPISGSPICVDVTAAVAHAPSCLVSQLPEEPAGTLLLRIEGRDAFGNSAQLAANDLTVSCEPAEALMDVAIRAECNGAKPAAILVLKASIATGGLLHLSLGAEPICRAGLPFQAAPSAACQLRFIAPASGQLCTEAGERLHVMLEVVGSGGWPTEQAELDLEATLGQDDSCTHLDVIPSSPGLYSISCLMTQAGDFAIAGRIVGDAAAAATIQGVCSPSATSAAHCTANVTGLDTWQPGSPGSLIITRHDRLGNRVLASTDEPSFTVSVSGPAPAYASVEECGDGTAKVSCYARCTGRYTLSVQDPVTSENVAGSPFMADLAPGPLCPAASSYRLLGVTQGPHACTLQAGQTLAVVIDARDAYGNPAAIPAEDLSVEAQGPLGALRMLPQDGALPCTTWAVPVTLAGSYAIAVRATDAHRHQAAIPAAHGASTVTVVPGMVFLQRTILRDVPSALVAGVSQTFYIQPVDAYGNAGAAGANFTSDMTSGSDTLPCTVSCSALPDRTTAATICVHQAGSWQLTVRHVSSDDRLDAVVARSSVIVEEAATNAAHSFLTGFWPAHGAVAGVMAGFIVQACDAFGNRCSHGGDCFEAKLRGLESDAITITDRQDGSYAVQYCIPHEGSHIASVTLDGQHVRGSPATFMVFRDVAALADQEMEKRLSATLSSLRRGITEARQLHETLRGEAKSLSDFIPVLVESTRTGINDALRQQEALVAEMRAAYNREAAERRRLHNVVQELRGNIRVYVRVKPLTAAESGAGLTGVLRCPDDHRIQCTAQGSTKAFDFDRVFGPEVQQEEVFVDVSQLVTSALDGYNVCIFAYGQTGAGKTFTMEGSKEQPGIHYRAMKELFRSIREERSTDAAVAIHVSIVEIYNEVVNDLLSAGGKREVELQRAAGGFAVPDLTQVEVTSPEQIHEIMACGFEHRAVGCHDINAHSSRSHCLLVIHVAVTDASTGMRTVGKLTLCDLAGSERIAKTHATGLTLTEAQNINRSLLELGNVISALMQQSTHVPYRNSKLTMLLQDSLGGDAKALMFCNLSSLPAHAAETLSSLGFASKVANVVLKTPQRKFVEGDQKEYSSMNDQSNATDKKRTAAIKRTSRN